MPTSLTFHESEHGLQITATFINHVEHITSHSAISSQVIIRAHPGWAFIAEVTVSLVRAQSLGPMRVVYPIDLNYRMMFTDHSTIRILTKTSMFYHRYNVFIANFTVKNHQSPSISAARDIPRR